MKTHRRCYPYCDPPRAAFPYTLWVVIFPAEGGAKIVGGSTEAYRWEDSKTVAQRLIAKLASEAKLTGEFAATYRHCFGQQTPQMIRFTSVTAEVSHTDTEF